MNKFFSIGKVIAPTKEGLDHYKIGSVITV